MSFTFKCYVIRKSETLISDSYSYGTVSALAVYILCWTEFNKILHSIFQFSNDALKQTTVKNVNNDLSNSLLTMRAKH